MLVTLRVMLQMLLLHLPWAPLHELLLLLLTAAFAFPKARQQVPPQGLLRTRRRALERVEAAAVVVVPLFRAAPQMVLLLMPLVRHLLPWGLLRPLTQQPKGQLQAIERLLPWVLQLYAKQGCLL